MRDYVFPMFRANAVYEGQYLLGTSIARPLIAKHLVDIARKSAPTRSPTARPARATIRCASASAYALEPDIKIIAPWREWSFASAMRFSPSPSTPDPNRQGQARRSAVLDRANLLHVSSEGKVLEDPAEETPALSTRAPFIPRTRLTSRPLSRSFRERRSVAIDGKEMSPATLLTALNKLGHDNGIGRLDLVENRFVGMKSRGVYETPGGTILLGAHRASSS